jgi:hypothetical protein
MSETNGKSSTNSSHQTSNKSISQVKDPPGESFLASEIINQVYFRERDIE